MRSSGWKAGLFILIIAASVFFGIEVATSGLERVSGPMAETRVSAPPIPEPQPQLPTSAPAAALPPSSAAAAAEGGERTFSNQLAMKLGDVLRLTARWIIRSTAAIFDAIMH